MRCSSPTARLVLAASAWAVMGHWSAERALGKPPENPPIVLHYQEAAIFLGPHEHSVTAIAFSPDGKTVATGTGYLRLWDVATGRLKSIHADDACRGISGLSFSSDGRVVASVGAFFGNELLLWDPASLGIARGFEEPAGSTDAAAAPFIYKGKSIVYRVLNAVAFSPDGRILATAPGGVVLRDGQSGTVVATLDEPAKGVTALAFSADGKTLATAGSDKKVRLWSLPAGALEATLDGPTQPLAAVAISPDGTRIVAASNDKPSILNRNAPTGRLWAWDRPSGPARKIELGNVQVRQVAFVAPTTAVVAAGREVLSVDLREDTSTRPSPIWSHSQDVLAIAVSPDGRLVASGGKDRTVDLVDLATGKLVHRLPGLTDIISSVSASRDGKRFATATMDVRFSNRMPTDEGSFAERYKAHFSGEANAGRVQPSEVRIWSTGDGRLQSMLPLPACQATAIDFVPGGDQIAVAGWIPENGGMLSLWDATGGKHLRDFAVQNAEVLSIAVSPDGRTLASGDADGNLDLWDVPSGKKSRSHQLDHPVEAVTYSADGKLLAVGDADRTVRVFDASSGAIVRTLKSRSYIESLDFSPDATLLAAGTRDPGLELWDLRGDAPSQTLKVEGDHLAVMAGFVAFSPDGRFVVCGGHGKDIAVFDVAKRAPHVELRGHGHPATAITFLPNGRLISGGEERTIRLWDPSAGKLQVTWNLVPADQKQNWDDQWVGFKPSGEFAGSTRLDRLVGWQSGGDVLVGPESGDRRRRVESLFQAAPSVPSARE